MNVFKLSAGPLLSGLILSGSLWAQSYHFENFTAEDGLSQSQILEIHQDGDGALWLGTNNGGITIYDGHSYEVLNTEKGLVDNVVFSIEPAQDGSKLIGTNGGLSVLDNRKFTNYTIEDGLSHDRIFDIFTDSRGTVWLGTGAGVTKFEDGTFTPLTVGTPFEGAAVVSMSEDRQGRVWFSSVTHGLIVLDKGTYKNYTIEDGLPHNYVHSVYQKGPSEYWIFTYKGMAILEDGVIRTSPIPGIPEDDPVYNWAEDKDGNLWIGTRKGVLKYNGRDFQLYSKHNGMLENDIWKILQDREGNIWLGSRTNGLSKLFNEHIITYDQTHGLASDYILSLFHHEGNLLIGTKQGLDVFDGETFTNYGVREGLCSGMVYSIDSDDNGTLYMGTDFGLSVWKNGRFDSLFADQSDEQIKRYNKIFDVTVDESGGVWLGTFAGVAKMKRGKLVPFKGLDSLHLSVYQVFEDSKGMLWFCTEKGLYKSDGHWAKKVKVNAEVEQFRTIAEDANGDLWLGTNNGIVYKDGNRFRHFTADDGLASNTIYSLAFDQEGFLWAGLANGIDKLKIAGDDIESVRHFDSRRGFTGQECNLNALIVDDKNTVWCGTVHALTALRPKFERENRVLSLTKIKNVLLESVETNWREFAESFDSRGLPKNLELPYDRNHMTFSFVGVSLSAPKEVKYKYMLKGYDDDWLPVTHKNEVVYSNLPPGDYEFVVMSDNGYGVWNEEPQTFRFTILPPFWKTWWFYSICALIVSLGIYSYFKIRAANKKITLANKEISHQKELVDEKNQEILDSITYAKRLQEAILPPARLVREKLPSSFVLYKPKDIVAGDFYWLEQVNGHVIFAAADCTGHGVPGAMVSVVCHNALNRSVREFGKHKPSEILDQTRELVVEQFERSEEEVRDGMDIALCALDGTARTLDYSGANNSLYIISKGQLSEIKPDKQPIAKHIEHAAFTNHHVQLKEGDMIYIFSDGFADQFGGPKGKKFKYAQFKQLLVEICEKPLEAQEQILDNTIEQWMGSLEQVDDICIIGVRV